jgi:plastocyanin
MKRKKLTVLSMLVIGFFCFTGLSFAAEEKEEAMKLMNKVVMVHAEEGATPASLTSPPGTTVIWVNQSPTTTEILFLDKKVVLACGSPVNFFVGKDGAYESGKLPFGGTASLCFTEKGKYDYIIRPSSTYRPLKDARARHLEHHGFVLIQ